MDKVETPYIIYHARNLKPLNSSISNLILAPEECLVWALDQPTAQQVNRSQFPSLMDLQHYPLAANYRSIGSSDIRNKIVVQDPFLGRGPYILNQQINSAIRTFRKENFE